MIELARLLTQLPRRTTEAVVEVEAPRHEALRRYLHTRLNGSFGSREALMAPPAIEGAFPWLPADPAGAQPLLDSLHPLVRERVPAVPFAHQVEAWQHLLDDLPRSVVVTAGTGAGKTECFLLPVVEHLARQAETGPGLTGVRAILLYPLNALINSQCERLDDWLKPFDGRIRFALYNGATPEDVQSAVQKVARTEVLSRKGIRNAPPPILVTNPAMLEYMLVRQQDAPILNKSQGTLDFVILDEAHTYVGSQAAEIALLLRRVCLAFGRSPAEVRYVATSATIGEGGAADARLRGFLAEVSGAPLDRITLVHGHRAPLALPEPRPDAPVSLDALDPSAPQDLWDRLAHRPELQAFIRDVYREPRPWSAWADAAARTLGHAPDTDEAARLLEATAAATSRDGVGLLPARIHVFHRAISGLWACVRRDCAGRADGLEVDAWRFGTVFLEAPKRCPHCTGPVFELTFCAECGQEELECEQLIRGDGKAFLHRPLRAGMVDEFALEADHADDDEPPDGGTAKSRFFVNLAGASGTACDLGADNDILDALTDGADRLWLTDAAADAGTRCRQCGAEQRGGRYGDPSGRPFRIGAPFLLGTMLPGLLDTVSPLEREEGPPPPAGGRRLLVFSDSRQGTARLAAKLQIDAERHFVRAFVYHSVQRATPVPDPEGIAALRNVIVKLRSDPAFRLLLAEQEARLAEAESTAPKPMPWSDLRDALARDLRLERHLLPLWKGRDTQLNDRERLADFVLQREFARRPKRANNAETMGLVRLVLPSDKAAGLPPPHDWPLGPAGWVDLLHLLVTHVLRSRSIVAIDPASQRWMRWKSRFLVSAERADDDPRYLSWPGARRFEKGRASPLLSLLAQACGLELTDPAAADLMDQWIETAAGHLRKAGALRPSGADGEVLHLDALAFRAVEEAAVCPITRKVLDTTLAGLSPYPGRNGVHPPAVMVRFPRHPEPFPGPARRRAIEDWIAADGDIQALSMAGLWGNLHARIAITTDWHRLAEHSAQQSIDLLKTYEDQFKSGWINILSSSTTLEMGIDIGDIEAVAMTNAPPSAANYRQRVGRAGRRRQPLAVGLTLCRDRPHDRAVFADPLKPFTDTIRPPSVALGSDSIARRHVHAWLLGHWVREEAAGILKMQVGAFFGLDGELPIRAEACPAQAFGLWLDGVERDLPADPQMTKQLGALTAGTPVIPHPDLIGTCRKALDEVADAIHGEWAALHERLAAADERAVQAAERIRLRRLLHTFVLGELADRGFLPGYGFPRNIVPFVTLTAGDLNARQDKDDRRDERARAQTYPSRNIDLALAEYAPGAEVVVDGMIYKSGGITLNWQRPAGEDTVREMQALSIVWRCATCGTLGHKFAGICPACSAPVSAIPMIKPAGFAVDIRDRPHDDPLVVSYVRPPETWVSAGDAPWRPLPDPEVGAYRSAQAGEVVVLSRGPHDHGYAVCLACGRAAAEIGREAPENPLAGHLPLRGGGKGKPCDGNLKSFALRRRHALGRTCTTDIFELRLAGCRSRGTALAVAVALREALAEALGVEIDEMGIEAVPGQTEAGEAVFSAILFDRADGGAGFASAAARGDGDDQDLGGLLRKAAARLDCPVRCDTVCERCLLSAATQYVAPELDRRAALELVQRRVLPGLALDPAAAVFGPASRPELADLTDAVGRALAKGDGAIATVFLLGAPEDWDLADWPVGPLAAQWTPRGATVLLAVEDAVLADMSPEQRLALGRYGDRNSASVVTVPHAPVRSGFPILASVGGTAWAGGPDAVAIGPAWGEGMVIRGPTPALPPVKPVEPEYLLRLPPDMVMAEIRQQLDGPAGSLARRIRDVLKSHGLGDLLGTVPAAIDYTDRYVSSPLTVRLVTELVAAFGPRPETPVQVRTGPVRPQRPGFVPSRIFHDWPDDAGRKAAVEAWFGQSGRRSWRFDVVDRLPHARRLAVRYPDGRQLLLTLDQGVGFLEGRSKSDFPFRKAAAAQASDLAGPFDVRARIAGPEPATFWTITRR